MSSVFKPEDVTNLQVGDTLVMRDRKKRVVAIECPSTYTDLGWFGRLGYRLLVIAGDHKSEQMLIGRLIEVDPEDLEETKFVFSPNEKVTGYYHVASIKWAKEHPERRFFGLV